MSLGSALPQLSHPSLPVQDAFSVSSASFLTTASLPSENTPRILFVLSFQVSSGI